MDIKKCSNCNSEPQIQSDELGITYRLICTTCNNFTRDLISRGFTPANPHCDSDTYQQLIQMWNDMN